VLINEKDVVKNVEAATIQGARAGAAAVPSSSRRAKAGALFALALAATVSMAALAPSLSQARQAVGLGADVSLSSLPAEARRTDQLIHSGGPFPFSRDGVVFGNYEKRLPREPRGWYHEYTVPTPGARNRGARRIICGGNPPTEPDACFYTEDHYSSFHRIVK
jgi:ribonuclease T1